MWPRLLANKILKKRLGSNNFVADIPSNNNSEALLEIPLFGQSSSVPNAFYRPPVQNYK